MRHLFSLLRTRLRVGTLNVERWNVERWNIERSTVVPCLLISLSLLLLLTLGCGRQKSPAPGKTPSQFMQLATREQIEGLSREAVTGQKLYNHYCAVCHGETGAGDGFNSFNLQDSFGVMPANLAEPESPLTIETIQETVRNGGAAVGKSKYMPPWGGTLHASQIHAVALYVQHFANAAEASQTSAASSTSAPSE